METKHASKVGASVRRDLTLWKNSIEKSKSVYMKINSSTSQGSHFHKTGISLWWGVFSHINVSSRFAGTFLFMKSMGDIFKDCRQAFG